MTAPTPTREKAVVVPSDAYIDMLHQAASVEWERWRGGGTVSVEAGSALALAAEIRSLRSSNAALRRALEAIRRIAKTPPQSPSDETIVQVIDEALEGET
jgi:hypothetical protein